MPRSIRRWDRAAVAAALLVGLLPTPALGAAGATVTIDAITPPTCGIDADGGGNDPCLVGDAVEFIVVAANTADATLTHVNLSVPIGPAAVSGADGLTSVQASGGTCRPSGATLSCSLPDMPGGASVAVRLFFDPTDHPDQYLETVTYQAAISMTAKAATKAGSKQNFSVECACSDSVTFLLAAQDDDQTTTYTATSDAQHARVTPPVVPGTKFFVFTALVSRMISDFCGSPATVLQTCFGDTVQVEVEDQNGDAYIFENCNLGATLRDSTCIRIDIAWDPAESGMPVIYQLSPQLITVYHDGAAIPRCDPLVDDPDTHACSLTPEVLGADDPRGPAGWVVVTIYTDRNGNWGAG